MRAVVTGAGSGIGRAVARRFAADAARREERAQLLLVDLAEDGIGDLSAELGADGHRVSTLALDLAQPNAGDAVAARAAETLDGVDALISNAGMVAPASLLELELEDWERVIAVNLRATWLLGKALHDALRESKGALVATSSIASFSQAPLIGAYAPSKAGQAMLIEQMAYEWGPDGIRCNCVSPGTTLTGMTRGSYSDPVVREERASRLPLRRLAEPADLAAAICFLASPDAAYITGVNLLVDGGFRTTLIPGLRGLSPP